MLSLRRQSGRYTWTWPLAAYAALVALYYLFWALPGRPTGPTFRLLVIELLIELVVIAGLFTGRRWAWWIALVRAVGAIIVAVQEALASGGASGSIALLVVSVATLAVVPLLRSPRLASVV